jgi:hypothetical protein
VNLSNLPGSRWVAGLQSPTLRVGVLAGMYMIVVMVVSLVVANRVPWLEGFASIRNAFCYGAFGLVMLIPVARFRRSGPQLFLCGIVAWLLLTLAYTILGLWLFRNLFSFHYSQSPFHLLVLGGVIYGVLAVAAWVASLLSHARGEFVTRRRPY